MRFDPDRDTPSTNARDTSRTLRRDMSVPEVILWNELRARRLGGLKFRRQHPVGPYIADFFCAEADLIVEIDGSTHNAKRDAARDEAMAGAGLHTLRVPAGDVSRDLHGVLHQILTRARRQIEEKREREVMKGKKK